MLEVKRFAYFSKNNLKKPFNYADYGEQSPKLLQNLKFVIQVENTGTDTGVQPPIKPDTFSMKFLTTSAATTLDS